MAVNLQDPYLIVTQWGKGFICVQESHTDRSLAMRRLHTLSSNHYKKHKRSNVPVFYLWERIAFMVTIAAANKPKRIPKKSIPQGVVTHGS